MAYDSGSAWMNNPAKQTDTKKSEEMRLARSPVAGNVQNTGETSEKKNGPVTEGSERSAIDAQSQKQKQQRKPTPQQEASAAQVDQVASRIGNFGLTLKAKVNDFLTKSASTVGVQDTSKTTYSSTGMKIQDELSASVDPTVKEKVSQQGAMKQFLSPFSKQIAGKLYGKEFDEVLQDLAAQDPEMARKLPELLNMVSMIDQMESVNADSQEARALRAQLESMDSTGIVSGLKRAKDDYENAMGLGREEQTLKWQGDEGNVAYTATELANLSEETLRGEVNKALLASSGLFGGDFEANLKGLYDTEAAEVKASNRQKEALHGQLVQAMSTYVDANKGEFEEAEKKIDSIYHTTATKIIADLQKSGDTQAAAFWAEALSGGDLAGNIYKALNDKKNGLSTKQRDAIRNFLGETDTQNLGEFGSWMKSLKETGKIRVNVGTANAPSYQDVDLSASTTMQLLQLAQDNTISQQDKTDKMKAIIGEITAGGKTFGARIQESVDLINDSGFKPEEAAATFQQSFMDSMKTYAKSKTEMIFKEAMKSLYPSVQWDSLTLEQKQSAMKDIMSKNPKVVETIKQGIQDKLDKEKQLLNTLTDEMIGKDNGKLAIRVGDLQKDETKLKSQYQKIEEARVSMPQQIADSIAQHFSGIDIKTTSQKVAASPMFQHLVQTGAANLPSDADTIAKSLYFYQAYKELAQMDPIMAEEIYGGQLYKARDPNDFLKSGDMASLRATVTLTEQALSLVNVRKASSEAYSRALSAQKPTAWQGAMKEQDKKLVGLRSAVIDQLDKNNTSVQQLISASQQYLAFVDQVSKKGDYSVDDILGVALGAGYKAEGNTARAADVLQGAAIKYDENGVAYLQLSDGTPIRSLEELTSKTGLQQNLTAQLTGGRQPGITDAQTQTSAGMTWGTPTAGEIAGYTPPPPPKPAATPRDAPDKNGLNPVENTPKKSASPRNGIGSGGWRANQTIDR